MVRRSAPASSKCVAYVCRSVWGVTRLWRPALRTAYWTASQTTYAVIGASARQPCRVPGKRYVRGRIHR